MSYLERNWKRLVNKTRPSLAFLAALAIVASTVVVISPVSSEPAVASTPAIDCVGTVANGIAVSPSHGKVVYIDTGQGQNINASYVGYKVAVSGTNRSDIWVKLDGFEDDIVQLANPLDQSMQLGAINANSSKVSYFLLKADRPTTVAQTHNVRVFNGNPTISGNTELYSCKFTFQRVRETIKAAANKVRSVSATAVSAIGDVLEITHTGETGQIGAGSAPDGDMIWLSPVSNAEWPTRALRLESVSVVYWATKQFSGSSMTKVDELFLSPARNSITGTGNNKSTPSSYVATYRFKVIGKAKATIAPVAQISSGTQIKHTDMAGYYNTNGTAKYPVDTTETPVNATNTKVGAGTSSIVIEGENVVIGYSIAIKNNGSAAIVVDDIVDTAASSLVFRAGSAKTGGSYPGTTATTDAFSSNVVLGDGSVDSSKRNWTFSGPFSVGAGATLDLHYSMLAPCQSGSYTNSAIARIGDTQVGTSDTTTQEVATTLELEVVGGACTIVSSSQATQTVTRGTEVTTMPATLVTTSTNQDTGVSVSSAQLNGTVDSNGVADQTIRCEYSTESNLAGSVLVDASAPADGKTTTSESAITVACGVNNLVAGTTYYFRISVQGASGTPAVGAILNFTTPPPTFSTPTVVTNSPTNFATVSSKVNLTFNSTINPRGNPTRVRFEYQLANSTCTTFSGSLVNISKVFRDEDLNTNTDLVLSGGFEVQVSFDVTGLDNNASYCYRALGDYPWNSDTNSAASTLAGSWVAFKASGTNPPTVETDPATLVTGNSATLNGTVTRGSNDANISFCLTTTASTTSVLRDCITGLANPSPTSVSSGTVKPTLAATGLASSTQYYFQVIATDTVGPSYGNIETFTTTGPPLATTSSATNVLSTTATINGSVIANGADATVYFCFALGASAAAVDANNDGYIDNCVTDSNPDTAKLTNPTVTTPISANASAARSANLTSLTGESKYYFQILANSSNGWGKGELLSFTTPVAAVIPTVTTVDASSIAGTTATLNGTITAGNADTQARFCYGTAIDLSGCTLVAASPSTVSGNTSTNISYAATGLSPGATYYFQARGTNSAGSSEGVIRSFITTSDPAQARTDTPSPIGVTSATLKGTVTAGTHAIQSVQFCLATSNTVTDGVLRDCGAGTQGSVSGGTIAAGQTGTPSVAVTGLTGGTTYYVQVKAIPEDPGVVAYGEVLAFTTDVALATAQTIAADSITQTSARLNGKVSTGTYSGIASFCISLTGDTAADTIGSCLSGRLGDISQANFSAETAVTDVNVLASNLVADTVYYFQVIITPSTGDPVLGEVLSFRTDPIDPEATTVAASSVAGKSAKLNASIKAGSKKVTVRFCLSTVATTSSWGGGGGGGASVLNDCPNASTNWRTASSENEIDGNSTGTPFLDTTGLIPNTTYYFQVGSFPTSGNPAFGGVKSFKTPLIKPEVRTLAPTDVSETGARLNGEANANNSRTTVRFCLSRFPNTEGGILKACVDSSQVSFSTTRTPNNGADIEGDSLLTFRQADLSETDLEDDVTYYYQAIATNDAGTAVGEVMSFTTGERRPEATTSEASSVAGKTARLNGTARAGSKQVNVRFCLSTANTTAFWSGANVLSSCPNGDPSWKNPNAASTLSKNVAGVPYLDTTGLIPNKTYFFQVGSFPTSGDPAFGEVKSFKTPLIAPDVVTLSPNNVSETGARLNAAANANNSRTTVRFCISESSATTNGFLDECADTSDVSRTTFRTPTSGDVIDGSEEVLITDQEATLSIDDLESETTYYYQAIATNDAGTSTGNVLTFTTSSSNSIDFPGLDTGGGSGSGGTGGGSSSNPNNPITPVNPGLVPNAPTAPNTNSGAGSNSGAPAQGSGSTSGPAGSGPDGAVLATIDLGNRSLTLGELARERTPGFSDGTGVSVLVTGSRVTGQFVVTPGESLDSIGLALALEESSGRWGEDFANISSARSISAPPSASVYKAPVDETALDTFSRSGLQKPKTLTDFNFSSSSKWLSVSADANTYLPGTKIYLTVTSEPVIFAEAVVDRNGQAQLVGALPLDILPAGGHSIRIVGTRSIEGVTADSEGVLQLSSEAIDKISKFDAGTMATVIMSGDTPLLNQQRLVREVLLGKGVPWWTIWFAAIVSLVSLGFLFYRRKSLKRLSLTTPLVALAGSIPAIVLGWWTISYLISYLGLAIGLGSAAILVALPRYFANKNNKAKRKTKRVSA